MTEAETKFQAMKAKKAIVFNKDISDPETRQEKAEEDTPDFNIIDDSDKPSKVQEEDTGFLSKLSGAVKGATGMVSETLDQVTETIQDALFEAEEGAKSKDSGDESRPSRANLRAYQAAAFRSFTAGVSIEQKHQQLMQEKAGRTKYADDDHISENEREKILRQIEQEDSDDDSSSSDESNADDEGKDSDSIVSDQELLNRSLQSDKDEAVCSSNYLRYASEKVNQRYDMMEVIDKNERSFKQVAEKMIAQSSQLVTLDAKDAPTHRRLMHQKLFARVADRFHGDINVAQGVPYSIAAIEDLIAIGSSDGSVRLFDQQENEVKTLTDKSVRNNAVTCLDIKRLQKDNNIFVISGHAKGHISLYELKGFAERTAAQRQELSKLSELKNDATAWYKEKKADIFGNIQFKHHKTLEDIHKSTVVQIKFFGDFTSQLLVISCDITGEVQLTQFKDTVVFYRADSQPVLRKRLSASYSLAPLVQIGASWKSDEIKGETQREVNPFNSLASSDSVPSAQICAFGTLEEIYVAQLLPSLVPLLSMRRPAYIPAGTVPYLDWGNALTPSYRDKAYPVLAIAWGRTIQLVVYKNDQAVKRGLEQPQLQLDGFYICEGINIDSIFFLSESLVFVIVNKKEVRILYTQNFTPGVFDSNYSQEDLQTRKVGADSQAESEQASIHAFTMIKEKYAGEVSVYAEKDCGYRMLDEEIRHKDASAQMQRGELRSKFNFNPTVCKNFDFNVIALGKTQIGQRTLIHWEEYLDFVDKTNPDDWLKVLRAALEIFNGRSVGLAGLPDSKEKREQLLRERMKDLLRQNMNAVIREFQEGDAVSTRTLRVATEFCIRVGAIDHIFGELFFMFSNAGVEQRYFENLDAFILSGKLKNVRMPVTILDRLISFYYNKDVELLEKAILNLNLSKYPDVLSVRQICEQEFLSSALIHLLTTLFDEEDDQDATTCLSILCALFNLMTRSKHQKTRKDVESLLVYQERFGTSLFEMSSSDANKLQEEERQAMFRRSRLLKLEIERSSTYIGYKLLWVIRLFLEGKKFPSGSLSSDRWRYYVYDVVRFCTNSKFMQWFLEFDAEAFFQILRKLFNEPEPYEYIRTQESFIQNKSEKNPFLEPCFSHLQILTIVEHQVNLTLAQLTEAEGEGGAPTEKSEALQNAWIFFLTSVAKNKKIEVPKEMGLRVVRQQIQFHNKLFRLPKGELLDLIPETQHARREKDRTCNIYTYLVRRNERDIIQILCLYQQELTEVDITELLEEVRDSPLFKLKIYLHQHQGDFQKCLTLFFQVKAIKSELFAWLNDVQKHLITSSNAEAADLGSFEAAAAPIQEEEDSNYFDIRGVPSRISYIKMKELICQNIGDFVHMDPVQTVKICDQWFDRDYMKLADELKDHKELAYSFLETVLRQNEQQLIDAYEHAVMQNQKETVSTTWKDLLVRLVEILCERKPKQASHNALVKYVSLDYFPVQESLEICERKLMKEACAVLCKRKGDYQRALKLYLETMVELCVDKLIHTIFVEKHIRFEDPLCTNEHMQTFDALLSEIIKICDKTGSRLPEADLEKLWLYAIRGLFSVQQQIYSLLQAKEGSGESSDDDSDREQERFEERLLFEKFLLIRKQKFMQRMCEHVKLANIILFLEVQEPHMKYTDFQDTFEGKIHHESLSVAILKSARRLIGKEVCADARRHENLCLRGFQSDQSKCDSCRTHLLNKWDKQEIWMLPCDHVFHARCIAKTDGQCTICFKEHEVLDSLQTLRQNRVRRDSATSRLHDDETVEFIRARRIREVRQSVEEANVESKQKRSETREERTLRLMTQHDDAILDGDLSFSNFQF